jgi:hypothetical protein
MGATPLARTLVYGLQGLHVQDERFDYGGSTNGTSSSGSSRTDTSRRKQAPGHVGRVYALGSFAELCAGTMLVCTFLLHT